MRTVDGIDILLRAAGDFAMDVVNLKISKVGGLTRARRVRDVCVSLGIALTIEDSPRVVIGASDIPRQRHRHCAHGPQVCPR